MTKVIGINDAKTLNLPGRRSREIVGAGVGAQNSTVRLVEIDPDMPGAAKRGPHVHFGFEESIHVLGGEGMMRADSGEFPVIAGDTILVSPGEKHATYNTGTTVLRLLCFFPINDIGPGTIEFQSWNGDEGGRDA